MTRACIVPAYGPFVHLETLEGFRRPFLRPDGSAYPAGARFVMPGLGRTLAAIGRDGRDAFYRGSIAAQLCAYLEARGGLLTEGDFAGHRSRWTDPIHVRYRDWTVCNTPPPTQRSTSPQPSNIIVHYPV